MSGELLLIVLFGLAALGLFGGMLLLPRLIGPRRATPWKAAPFESGFRPDQTIPMPERLPVKFYLVGVLFLLFDIETVLLYPWALVARDLRWAGVAIAGSFIGVVLLGYVYLWRRGALEWKL